MERLGGRPSRADAVFDRLRAAWSAKDRRYHDLSHLADCLSQLDGAGANPNIADVAELALWYHDAIYDVRARDSEERSAALLCDDGAVLEIPREQLLAAAACVRATAHLAGVAPRAPAIDLVIDVDLSILGRDSARFQRFESAVREEYSAIPQTLYYLARGRFLTSLLHSPSIFRTDHFHALHEERARANIAALLQTNPYRTWRLIHRIAGRFL